MGIFNEIRKSIFLNYLKFRGVREFPKSVLIETTNSCPLNCVMCPRQFMKRKIGVMDMNLFRKIIGELSTKKIENIEFHLFGEPLTHPEVLFKMLDYAHQKVPKTKLRFSDNCLLLSEKNAIKILKSPLNEITLSLDGATKETYEKLRRNSNFELVMGNVERFLNLKKKINPNLKAILQIIKMSETEGEIGAFKRKWAPFLGSRDEILVKEFTTFGGKVEDKSIKSLRRRIARAIRNSMPCRALWTGLNIQWNGDVVACCMDCDGALKIGNCRASTLTEIMNGEKMKKLREMSLNLQLKKLPLCAGCYKSY